MRLRLFAAFVAAFTIAGLAAQTFLNVQDASAEGGGVADALWSLAGYFTIWGNVSVALVAGAMAIAPGSPLAGARARLAVLPSILIVGVLFTALLRHLVAEAEPAQALVHRALHDVVPVLFLVLYGAAMRARLRVPDAAYALVLPAAYVVAGLARGLTLGFWPYWFLDLPELGALVFARNAALLLAAFALIGLALVGLDRLAARARSAAAGA